MPRDIPGEMQEDLIITNTGGAWFWLCEIAVPGYATKYKARNTEDVTYGEQKYDRFNFDFSEQIFSSDGSIPRVTLRVSQDINREIETIINETQGAAGTEIKLIKVCEKYLDTPIPALAADYDNLTSESDTDWVTFTLGMPNPLTQRFPLEIQSSSMCNECAPSKFKGPKCQYAGEDSSCTGTYIDCYNKDNAEHWGGELGLDPSVMQV